MFEENRHMRLAMQPNFNSVGPFPYFHFMIKGAHAEASLSVVSHRFPPLVGTAVDPNIQVGRPVHCATTGVLHTHRHWQNFSRNTTPHRRLFSRSTSPLDNSIFFLDTLLIDITPSNITKYGGLQLLLYTLRSDSFVFFFFVHRDPLIGDQEQRAKKCH